MSEEIEEIGSDPVEHGDVVEDDDKFDDDDLPQLEVDDPTGIVPDEDIDDEPDEEEG